MKRKKIFVVVFILIFTTLSTTLFGQAFYDDYSQEQRIQLAYEYYLVSVAYREVGKEQKANSFESLAYALYPELRKNVESQDFSSLEGDLSSDSQSPAESQPIEIVGEDQALDNEMSDEMMDGEMSDSEMSDSEMSDSEMSDGEMMDNEMSDSESSPQERPPLIPITNTDELAMGSAQERDEATVTFLFNKALRGVVVEDEQLIFSTIDTALLVPDYQEIPLDREEVKQRLNDYFAEYELYGVSPSQFYDLSSLTLDYQSDSLIELSIATAENVDSDSFGLSTLPFWGLNQTFIYVKKEGIWRLSSVEAVK